MVAIAEAAGAPEAERRWYAEGRLFVDGVTQEVLEAALAAIGTAPLVPVPPSISPRQARLELHARGLLARVQEVVDAAPVPVQIEWEYGTAYDRSSRLITDLAALVPLSPAEVDEIYRAAAAL
ncbi:hypothetical protein [Teichococcus aestuarii]|uniref:hypothetical protein n=1 Tax=Teichococcus aestuarii TaxID=568898 RepID=UPI00360BA3E0